MTEQELKFCERFEDKLKLFNHLDSFKDNLTKKGKIEHRLLKQWLNDNRDKYLELNNL